MGNVNIWFYVLVIVAVVIVVFFIAYYNICSSWYKCLEKPNYYNVFLLSLFGLVSLGLLVWSGVEADSSFRSNNLETDVFETFYLGALIIFVIAIFTFFGLRTIPAAILIQIVALSLAIGTTIYECQQSVLSAWLSLPFVLLLALILGFMFKIQNMNSSFLNI